jgi:hypothetical protein
MCSFYLRGQYGCWIRYIKIKDTILRRNKMNSFTIYLWSNRDILDVPSWQVISPSPVKLTIIFRFSFLTGGKLIASKLNYIFFYSHGTRCAGEVAAARDNGVCGVGVAYHSKVAGKMQCGKFITMWWWAR